MYVSPIYVHVFIFVFFWYDSKINFILFFSLTILILQIIYNRIIKFLHSSHLKFEKSKYVNFCTIFFSTNSLTTMCERRKSCFICFITLSYFVLNYFIFSNYFILFYFFELFYFILFYFILFWLFIFIF